MLQCFFFNKQKLHNKRQKKKKREKRSHETAFANQNILWMKTKEILCHV